MKALWKGSISFGLVNIPVQMFSASQTREVKFSLLHKKDHSEIRYARICKAEDKEVPWNEIVKGFESEGKYIIMTEEDLKQASSEKSKAIEIVQFTDDDAIDSIYFEKPYVLVPDKGSDKAYALLMEVLKKSKKVAIGKYVIHSREHIAIIRPYGKFILLNQMRYHSDLVALDDLKAPSAHKVSPKEMQVALQLIHHMEQPFNPEEFHDTYVEEIKKIIKQKSKGKKVTSPPEKAAPSSKIHDIMSLLKASLEEEEEKHHKKRAHA